MLARFGLYCFLLFVFPQQIGVSILGVREYLASKDSAACTLAPILWPVRRGANRISCQPLQKVLLLKKAIRNVAWSKCVARCQTKDPKWDWIAGINQTWHVEVNDMAKRYSLDQKGLLRIRDVTETDNGTRYKCTVRPCVGCDPDSIFIILLFDPEEDIPNTTPPELAATSKCPTVFPTNPNATRKDVTASSVIPTKQTTATSVKTTDCSIYIVPMCIFAVLSGFFGVYSFCLRRKLMHDVHARNQQNQGRLEVVAGAELSTLTSRDSQHGNGSEIN